MANEKPTIIIRSKGQDGNIFFIIAKVKKEMRKARRQQEFNELWAAVQKGSYEEAIALIREKVDLIDLDGEI